MAAHAPYTVITSEERVRMRRQPDLALGFPAGPLLSLAAAADGER